MEINTAMCILRDGCTPNMCPCDMGKRFYLKSKENPATVSPIGNTKERKKEGKLCPSQKSSGRMLRRFTTK